MSRLILAFSGSLRHGSSNERLLLEAARLAPPGTQVELYSELASLPAFNPDLDREPLPEPVARLRAQVGRASGLLISSPEYAHGVPGALKNALDWLVPCVELPGKAVALLCGGEFAPAQLEETLRTMSTRVVRSYRIPGPVLRNAFGPDGAIADPGLRAEVEAALRLLAEA